jgi:hypothetical protein
MGGLVQFGAFIGPRANDIAGVRERLLAAERAGFDFVSIQDHPYVPSPLPETPFGCLLRDVPS